MKPNFKIKVIILPFLLLLIVTVVAGAGEDDVFFRDSDVGDTRLLLSGTGLYRDVKPGDRYWLTYLVGKGTERAESGKPIGFIGGVDFASAIYAMGLDRKPLTQSFKRQPLGYP